MCTVTNGSTNEKNGSTASGAGAVASRVPLLLTYVTMCAKCVRGVLAGVSIAHFLSIECNPRSGPCFGFEFLIGRAGRPGVGALARARCGALLGATLRLAVLRVAGIPGSCETYRSPWGRVPARGQTAHTSTLAHHPFISKIAFDSTFECQTGNSSLQVKETEFISEYGSKESR